MRKRTTKKRRWFLLAAVMALIIGLPTAANAVSWSDEMLDDSHPVIKEKIANEGEGYRHTITIPANMKVPIFGYGTNTIDEDGFRYSICPAEETTITVDTGTAAPFFSGVMKGAFEENTYEGTITKDREGVMYYLNQISEDSITGSMVEGGDPSIMTRKMTYECVPYKMIVHDGKLVIDATQNASLDDVYTITGKIRLSDKSVNIESDHFNIHEGTGTFAVQSNQKITLKGLLRGSEYELQADEPKLDTRISEIKIDPIKGTIGENTEIKVSVTRWELGDPIKPPEPAEPASPSSHDEPTEYHQTIWAKVLPVKAGTLKVTWTEAKGADYYVVYGGQVGKSMKKLKKTTKKEFIQKKLNKDKAYKYKIKAYINIRDSQIGESAQIKSLASKYTKKYSNVKSLSVTPRESITMKVGETRSLKVSQKRYNTKKAYYAKGKLRYTWSDATIIDVHNGKITALEEGKAVIDIMAVNGLHKNIQVTIED